MDSFRLTGLQQALLEAFFSRCSTFFLTGGAALVGFYFGHRETKDLDLFATPGTEFREGVAALHDGAEALGASVRLLRQDRDFLRAAVVRGEETTLVDLVLDRAPQVVLVKPMVGRVRLDPLREIAANKICATLDRFEARDLVDLQRLLAEGIRLADAVADAQIKHAGADPANLAWALSQIRVDPASPLPSNTSPETLEAFRENLIHALTSLALPETPEAGRIGTEKP